MSYLAARVAFLGTIREVPYVERRHALHDRWACCLCRPLRCGLAVVGMMARKGVTRAQTAGNTASPVGGSPKGGAVSRATEGAVWPVTSPWWGQGRSFDARQANNAAPASVNFR
jgi:hypothetical protein